MVGVRQDRHIALTGRSDRALLKGKLKIWQAAFQNDSIFFFKASARNVEGALYCRITLGHNPPVSLLYTSGSILFAFFLRLECRAKKKKCAQVKQFQVWETPGPCKTSRFLSMAHRYKYNTDRSATHPVRNSHVHERCKSNEDPRGQGRQQVVEREPPIKRQKLDSRMILLSYSYHTAVGPFRTNLFTRPFSPKQVSVLSSKDVGQHSKHRALLLTLHLHNVQEPSGCFVPSSIYS